MLDLGTNICVPLPVNGNLPMPAFPSCWSCATPPSPPASPSSLVSLETSLNSCLFLIPGFRERLDMWAGTRAIDHVTGQTRFLENPESVHSRLESRTGSSGGMCYTIVARNGLLIISSLSKLHPPTRPHPSLLNPMSTDQPDH